MIVCCGEALIDMIRVEVPGSGEGFLPVPGGCAYNTAIAIGRLGVPVQFLGRISTDFFGETLMRRLRANNVGCDLIVRSEQNTTLAFIKLEEGAQPRYAFFTEGTTGRSLEESDLPPRLSADTRCLLFGSISMTMEPIASTIETLILREGKPGNAAHSGAAPVITFDPNIRPFMIHDRDAYLRRFEKWTAASTIVKISAEDIEFVYPGLDVEHALEQLLALGPRLVIGTLGPDGAVALHRQHDGSIRTVTAPVNEVPVVDTVGAGDTFHGAFLSWLELNGKLSRTALADLSGADLYDGLCFANRAAAIVCTRRGAEPPALNEIKQH